MEELGVVLLNLIVLHLIKPRPLIFNKNMCSCIFEVCKFLKDHQKTCKCQSLKNISHQNLSCFKSAQLPWSQTPSTNPHQPGMTGLQGVPVGPYWCMSWGTGEAHVCPWAAWSRSWGRGQSRATKRRGREAPPGALNVFSSLVGSTAAGPWWEWDYCQCAWIKRLLTAQPLSTQPLAFGAESCILYIVESQNGLSWEGP